MMSACLLASTMAWAQTEDVEIPVPQPGSGSSFAISIGPKIGGVMTTMTQAQALGLDLAQDLARTQDS